MNVKTSCFVGVLLALLSLGCWAAPAYPVRSAPSSQSRPLPIDDMGMLARQFKNSLADLKHEVENHESEIRMFEEKLHTQEAAFDHMRQQVADDLQAQRDYARATTVNLEGKIETLDNAVKGVIVDLRQLKTQANDSVSVLAQYKQKLSELEKLIEVQNQHMANLETALHSMMEVLQAKEAAAQEMALKSAEMGKIYKVQSGDTLEKIARANKVTVQILRDYNHLSSDRIVVGQTLKIP